MKLVDGYHFLNPEIPWFNGYEKFRYSFFNVLKILKTGFPVIKKIFHKVFQWVYRRSLPLIPLTQLERSSITLWKSNINVYSIVIRPKVCRYDRGRSFDKSEEHFVQRWLVNNIFSIIPICVFITTMINKVRKKNRRDEFEKYSWIF